MRKIVKPENVFWTRPHSASPTVLRGLQQQILKNQKIQVQQHLLELLNEETRLQILYLLALKDFICVGDIADVLRLSTSAVSHQLRLLRKENLVVNKKQGKVVYYSLNRHLPELVRVVLATATNFQS